MSYPFAQAPRLRELVAKFEALGVESRASRAEVRGPRGAATIRYLARQDGDSLWLSEPLPEDDEERVFWDTARRLCRQLHVDPRDLDIGLELG